VVQDVQTQIEYSQEASDNLVGFFDLLLKIDRRNELNKKRVLEKYPKMSIPEKHLQILFSNNF